MRFEGNWSVIRWWLLCSGSAVHWLWRWMELGGAVDFIYQQAAGAGKRGGHSFLRRPCDDRDEVKKKKERTKERQEIKFLFSDSHSNSTEDYTWEWINYCKKQPISQNLNILLNILIVQLHSGEKDNGYFSLKKVTINLHTRSASVRFKTTVSLHFLYINQNIPHQSPMPQGEGRKTVT